MVFPSNNVASSTPSEVSIMPLSPLVSEFRRVSNEPLYAPLFSASYSLESRISRTLRATSAKEG